MPEKQLSTQEILTMLAAGPRRIAESTARLTPAQLKTGPAPDQWSANEVLAHLRACADVWGGAIETILAENKPTIRAVNPRTWIEETNYRDLNFTLSLNAFTAQRAALVARLEPLSRRGWLRSATVTGAGKTLERSVLFYAQWLATHERPHLKQIQRIAETFHKKQ